MKKRNLWVVFWICISSILQTSCTKEFWENAFMAYRFNGYAYYVTGQVAWYDPNQMYFENFNVRSNNYFNGYVRTPFLIGFIPRSYMYSWTGNQCEMTFFTGYNRTGDRCIRRFQYRNNQFYWLR